MKALAYQADPSSVPVGPQHRVSPAKASKKVINCEADFIKVINLSDLFILSNDFTGKFQELDLQILICF